MEKDFRFKIEKELSDKIKADIDLLEKIGHMIQNEENYKKYIARHYLGMDHEIFSDEKMVEIYYSAHGQFYYVFINNTGLVMIETFDLDDELDILSAAGVEPLFEHVRKKIMNL